MEDRFVHQKMYHKKNIDGTIGGKNHVLFGRKILKFYNNIWQVLISVTKDRNMHGVSKNLL